MSRTLFGPWLRTAEVSAPDGAAARAAGPLLAASARAVWHRAFGAPVTAALVLLAASWPVLGTHGPQVLIAVTVVLAFALLAAVDDPAGPVLAASPYSLTRRCMYRLAAAVAIAAPVWLLAAATVAWRADGISVRAFALQAAALWTIGVGIALYVWRSSASVSPSYVAGPVLLSVTMGSDALPRGWQLFNAQTWGPPWIAAQLRWTALLVLAVALIMLLLRDALDRRPFLRRRRMMPAPLAEWSFGP
jgi:hypothetical protein